MAKTLVQELADRLARLETRIASAEKQPRLSNASIDDETVRLKEGERVKGLLGRQPDGSHGSRVVESPAQPTPSAPILGSGKAGVVMVRWDGDADGPVPLVHGHVEVVASGPSSAAEVVSTIRDRAGGATSFVADESGTWSVHLVMVGQDRTTRSEPSQVSTIEVVMPVDGEQINDRLDAGEERLSDAKAEWETARQGLRSDLDTLNNTTLPALKSDLSNAQQDVDTIQNTTIPQVEQNLSNAEASWEQSKTDLQDGLDQINNETIPVIRDDVDANATAITQNAQDAQAEYDRLQEIAEQALAGAPNVIHDPSFETDWYQRAWGGENNLSVTTNSPGATEPTEGLQVLRASNDTGGTVAGELNFTPVSRKGDTPTNDVVDLSMNVRPGETWRFEVDVRALAAGFDGTMRLRCMKAGSFQTVENLAFTPGQSWETYTLDVTIPQDITAVYWRFQPTVESGGFFADRVSVKNITDFKQALDKAEAAAQAAQDAHEQAGEAWTRADTAMTRAGQVGARLGGETPPVGTAPENSLWFQWSDMDDPNRTVLGVWQMIDGNWTEQDSSEPALIPTVDIGAATVGTLKAVRIDVASLFADTAFVNSLHAETVEALKVTAETGFIGGVHLADGSVGARQIIASEVGAEVGTFVELDAGQVITGKLGAARIDVQQLMAQSAVIDAIRAESVEAMRVTSESGFIGGTLLENGAVTTEKLTVTESMTAAIASFLEVEAVHMTANSVTSAAIEAGAVTAAKIDVEDLVASTAFVDSLAATELSIMGTFQTAYPNGAGVTISRGEVTYWSAERNQMVTRSETPYIRLTPRDGEKDRDPAIATDGQRLVLAGGRDSDGNDQPVMIDGPVEAMRVNATYEVSGATLTLNSQSDGTLTQLNQTGLTIDPFSSQPTGISRINSRTRLVGRMEDGDVSTAMQYYNVTDGSWDISPGGGSRVSISSGAPAPFGTRPVIASPRVSPGTYGWENVNTVALSVTGEGSGGFQVVARAPSENTGTVRYSVAYTWAWK